MGNMERERLKKPSPYSWDTLDGCIKDFLWRRAPGGGLDVKADDIPAMCAAAETFADAVWIACASKRRNGKMHPHQTKVKLEARREFGYRIIALYPDTYPQTFPTRFDTFHDLIWDIRPEGIGPLTTYDVATRIGAYLKLEPDKIYLHTGARLGWEALVGRTTMLPRQGFPGRLPRSSWPVPLRQLSADMAEDFLCAYRDALARVQRSPSGTPI